MLRFPNGTFKVSEPVRVVLEVTSEAETVDLPELTFKVAYNTHYSTSLETYYFSHLF